MNIYFLLIYNVIYIHVCLYYEYIMNMKLVSNLNAYMNIICTHE